MKKIGLFCLCLASLSLAGCFHVPDEDWLPSNNKTETGNNPQNEDVEQAINSFIEGIDVVSTQRDELNKDENDDNVKNLDKIDIGANETFDNEITIENNTTDDENNDENNDQNMEYDAIIE